MAVQGVIWQEVTMVAVWQLLKALHVREEQLVFLLNSQKNDNNTYAMPVMMCN